MAFKELLEKVTDEALRKQLEDDYNKINHENGERGRKLIEKDEKIKSFENGNKQKSEWETTFKTLKDRGIDPKEIPGILEAMEVQKTAADELKLVTVLQKDTEAKLKAAEKEIKAHKVKTAVDSVFDEARKGFKDDKGQALTVLDEFIDKAKLYADVSDPENKVLLEQRAKEVLTSALQQQEALKAKFGFQGAQTHKVPEGSQTVGGGNNLSAELKEITQKHGAAAALSHWYKMQGAA